MREFIDYHCKFCKEKLENVSVIPPDCTCEGYTKAREEWLEEFRAQPDYQAPLDREEYDKKYPQTYLGERLVVDKDASHKIKLEARQYSESEGLTVWVPFPYKKEGEEDEDEEGAGLCWDFTSGDADALYDMLGEYLEKKNG